MTTGTIIAMMNNKGGVGKTSCTVNLAAALASKGKRVCVIDNDSQCNATSLLLGGKTTENTLYEAYAEGVPIQKCIYPTMHGVDIVPNSQITAQIEADLYHDTAASYSLLRTIAREHIIQNYDFAFIDCPPSLGLWAIQAMSCADGVIVPIESGDDFSIDGLDSVLTAITSIRESKINRELTFLKVLANKVDLRTTSTKAGMTLAESLYPGYIFKTHIPTNDAIKQAAQMKTTVLRYHPQASGSKRFRLLASELIDLVSEGI